jgi:hypothetical protein
LLITADAGGSNSYLYRLWKAELAVLAAETGLRITVCHFPPGTSKWNKIEHRLFSQITMNWRGRPLASHEVVVATIASTRTRTGLRVAAELDTGTYPLGLSVTRQQLAALPIQGHEVHGEWNYSIAPTHDREVASLRADDRAHTLSQALSTLSDPRLTGMSHTDLAHLAGELAPDQAAQGAQRRHEQRGGARRRARGAGSQGLLTDADKVLVTVVYLREICSQKVLSELLGVNPNSIGQAIAETRQLLTEHGRSIAPITLRFATADAITDFISRSHTPIRSTVPDRLGDPILTGMSAADLAALIDRVARVQAARNERHRYRRRGGERLPGARGGVFVQKISDTERVLAAVIYQRKLCTQQTLAELFAVSRRTIGDVVRELSPILAQDGHVPAPATTRYPTSAAILNALPAPQDTATPTS